DFEPVHGAHWRASACTTAAPCTLAGGQTRTIDVEFRPQRHGDLSSVLTVHSAVGTRTVTLAGSATGGVLSVLEPTGGEIDFGVIPLDAPRTRTVRLANPGNAAITATAAVTGGPGSPGSPFAVAPGSLALAANGGAGELEVTCRSPVAGSFTGSVALASDGYAGDTAIAVRCTVADTRLEVSPGELDFGEVRIGSDAPSIEVVLRNPGPLPLALASVALEGAPDALTATSVPPQTLEVGATAALTLALATGEDVALEAGPSQLVIHVDGEQLRLPVRGRVVTPAARIAPDRLDLGTLCIGSPVTGALALRNVGTATLQAAAPVIDPAQAFALRFIDPSSYPAILAPDTSAAIEVAPSSTTPGHVEGLVSWDVDVPSAPLAVPVVVEFIADGTAVSPREVRAESDVGMTTPWRTVTLQNCSSSPVAVTLAGVVAVVRGANAWDVTPRAEQRTLGPRETMAVQVRFAPKRPGAHQAYLDLSVGGAPLPVDLIGHAFGVEPERTSFYACACSTSANPIGGAPIAAALVISLRRRRRSPAMPRSGMLGR
ncbi:MAG: choice-of-anchor D domain-containing protein, partial [Kofleriaceae bacterium]